MAEPFLAEIRIVGFTFAPRGWAYCDGQILPINQNQSLYSLLGTTYGGDGRTSFALPDLRSRTPIHRGDGYQLGRKGGAETITLTAAQIGAHTHEMRASTNVANQMAPLEGYALAEAGTPSSLDPIYVAPSALKNLAGSTTTQTGGGQAHNNMQPYITVGYCIALQGLFPSRN